MDDAISNAGRRRRIRRDHHLLATSFAITARGEEVEISAERRCGGVRLATQATIRGSSQAYPSTMNRSTLYRLAEDRVSALCETGKKSWTFWLNEPDGSRSPGPEGSFYDVSYLRKLEMVNHARRIKGLKPTSTIKKSAKWYTQIPK